jgi:hypothetical protein
MLIMSPKYTYIKRLTHFLITDYKPHMLRTEKLFLKTVRVETRNKKSAYASILHSNQTGLEQAVLRLTSTYA